MGIEQFFREGDRIDSVEIVTFPPAPPRYARLRDPEGNVAIITTEMRDFGDRIEIGELLFEGEWESPDAGRKETLSGGRILSIEYLAPPGFDLISGVRIRLDEGELIVTAGAFPYSIYVGLGTVQRGEPEYSINEYEPCPLSAGRA